MRSLLLAILLCTYVCAQNILSNPSFEAQKSSWNAVGLGYTIVDEAEDGKYSARCVSLSKSGTRGASQTITVNQAKLSTVTVSAYSVAAYVSGTGTYAIQVDIEQMDGKKITQKSEWKDKTNLWTPKSVSYLANSVRRITVSLIFSGKVGAVWFDDVQASVVPYSAPPTSAPDNGAHESGPLPVPTIPATSRPSTAAPSTSAPTTGSPSTAAPTTGSPSTAAPSTSSPSTAAPTTGSPSTAAPTTGSPSTDAPTTGSPSTAAPTESPSTSAPTGSPSTDAPTGSPSTQDPSTPTGSPATVAPTVSPTGSPATEAPTTVAPTSSPVTDAPTAAPTPTPTPAPTAPPLPSTITIGFKYLILAATTDDIRLLVVRQTFDSVGSQYDVIVPSTFGNGSFPLTTGNGAANYYGVVFCTDVYGATPAQTAQLNEYLVTYKIKSVLMYSYPYLPNGVTVSPTKAANALYSDLTFASSAAGFISGYNKTTRIPSDEVYCYPAIVTNATMATPAMYFNYPGDATQYVASAFIKQDDGRVQLQFYLDMATWAPHAVAVGPFWLQWLSNNFYLGLRRIFLNCQIDDLFLASDLWDPDHVPVGQHEDGPTYRINETELYNHAVWQRALNARLPASSNITLDFPFNGNGIIEAGGFTVDKLYLMAKNLINEYVWQSHTYTHPYLDNLTYVEALAEMRDNLLPTTLQLFGSYNHPRYSNKSMVTPSISGFYNPNALQALWDVGIRYVVGDNSRLDLKTPFQYHGFYTTVAKNGFAGIHIMPREATYIYYDCSLPRELESEYNFLYTTYYGGPSTLDDIVFREGKRVTLLFLAFRNDPYMFHQANMREYFDPTTKARTSLLNRWIEAVISRFYQYYDLPIHSHSHDLLAQKQLNREARDACGFQSTLTVDTATRMITGISGSSTGQCSIAITGVQASAAQTKLTVETYGPDTTTWVYMNRDKFSFNFKTPVQM